VVFDEWLSEIRRVDVDVLTRPGLCDLACSVSQLRGALDALDARIAQAIEGLDDRGPNAATTMRAATKCSQREADRRSKRASALAEMPAAADALSRGEIGAEHVDSLVRAAEATSPAAVESSNLLESARSRPADIMAKDVREWTRKQQRTDDGEATARRRRSNRRGVVFEGDDGMIIFHAELDPVAGGRARAGVDAIYEQLLRDDGGRGVADEVRTPEQRRADAFEILLSGGAAQQGPPPVRSQLVVLAHADGRAEIPGLGPIPDYEFDRLTCVSDLFGLVFAGEGVPLWHGRSKRLATDDQWRALIARDHGCVICAAAASRCEAHHVVFWDGPARGPTDIANLALLCKHHHHLIHDQGLRLICDAVGKWRLEPP